MTVTVNLPDALRVQADGHVRLDVSATGGTVGDVLATLRRELPAVYRRIATEQGELRPHINVFIGDEDIRWSGGLAAPVGDGSEIHIIPAVSGGSGLRDPYQWVVAVMIADDGHGMWCPRSARVARSHSRG